MKILLKLISGALILSCSCSPKASSEDGVYTEGDRTYAPEAVRKVLDRQQKAAFSYFYDGAEPESGMAYEGNERENVVTTGGSGFGVMALIVGIERGWISREEGVGRMLGILDFLTKADRYGGVWSHWYNPDGSYAPFGDQKATGDLVETSFMMAGLLAAREYYTGNSENERLIRESIDNLYATVDWAKYAGPDKDGLYWLWYSETDRFSLKISGWNEALITYIMALAAPDGHSITPEIYERGWNVPGFPSRKTYGYTFPLGSQDTGGPLFFSHYSFLGLNPRLMQDSNAWYWQQNVSHTMINRHYCLNEASESRRYNVGMWGLTACYGAGSRPGYSARSPKNDDGVIAPTAALSSYPYTPFYSTQVLLALDELPECQGAYGLADSYMPSEKAATRKHLAIDQGPIVVMIENYRSGLIWDLLMKNEHVKSALAKAKIGSPEYKEGFPFSNVETVSGRMDLMEHPDRAVYEIEYFIPEPGTVHFDIVRDSDGETVQAHDIVSEAGLHAFVFDEAKITRGRKYSVRMVAPSGKTYRLPVILH